VPPRHCPRRSRYPMPTPTALYNTAPGSSRSRCSTPSGCGLPRGGFLGPRVRSATLGCVVEPRCGSLDRTGSGLHGTRVRRLLPSCGPARRGNTQRPLVLGDGIRLPHRMGEAGVKCQTSTSCFQTATGPLPQRSIGGMGNSSLGTCCSRRICRARATISGCSSATSRDSPMSCRRLYS
jgi:hypothetical protein